MINPFKSFIVLLKKAYLLFRLSRRKEENQ